MEALGIDVGGSGIKGARVDLESGELVTERIRYKTPRPAEPDAVIRKIGRLAEDLGGTGPLGVGFPAIVADGVARSAANISRKWIGVNARERIAEATGLPTVVLNDADAAGLAEMRFGAGRGEPGDGRDESGAGRGEAGVVVILTIGTGIGSAVFTNGVLVPNTELGHLYLRGHRDVAEEWASDRARDEQDLEWKEWAKHLDEYLHHLERLFTPGVFILGGGVSKRHQKFVPRLTVETPVVPAELRNEAGIVGAALAAAESGGVSPR